MSSWSCCSAWDPVTARAEAGQVAGKLAAAIAAAVVLAGTPVAVGASIGVRVSPGDAADFRPLLHVADTRRYAGKHTATR